MHKALPRAGTAADGHRPMSRSLKGRPSYRRASSPSAGGRKRRGPSSRGEMQFTEYGVSGPAVFDLSRAAAAEQRPLTLRMLDLLPRLSRPRTLEAAAAAARPSAHAGADLRRICWPECSTTALGRTLLRYAGFSTDGAGWPLSSAAELAAHRCGRPRPCACPSPALWALTRRR